ncbi:class II aldolase/adducin family protein [Isoptericola sp. NPDC056618]|uniref:class II aldolase/adducin family protein n=1 Tax=Isoptericola sp. NPDC056618 TaxID=3345878 RepID=UPI00369EF032
MNRHETLDDHSASRSAIVATARRLAAAGMSPGSSGNLSVRLPGAVLVTRRGADLAALEPADLVLVGDDGVVRADPVTRSGARPTKETAMHQAVYAARHGAGAVVHLHSHYATALACLPAGADGFAALPPYTPYRVMRLGDVPLVPFAPPGSAELAGLVGAAAARGHAMLLAQHGALVAAADLETAAADAAELEAASRLSLELAGRPAGVIDAAGLGALRA